MKKRVGVAVLAAVLCGLMAVVAGCATSSGANKLDANGVDPAIKKGVDSWNLRGPDSAAAYWNDILDATVKEKYLSFITAYNKGQEILDSTEGMKAEKDLLDACNQSIAQFMKITDKDLNISDDIKATGSELCAARIKNLFEKESVSQAKVLSANASKVYGSSAFTGVAKEAEVLTLIIDKRTELKASADSAIAITDIDSKIEQLDIAYNSYVSMDGTISTTITNSGFANYKAVTNSQKQFKKIGQDIEVQREKAIRAKAYTYKEQITESFSKEAPAGTGKKGSLKYEDILNHYNTVQSEMDASYSKLMALKEKYPNEVSQDVIDDINGQKKTLDSKIKEVKREIANQKEIESRGTPMTPLMVGLFNLDKSSTADNKKSRPAKFSSNNGKKTEYWWGMVSIPASEMNDLVITLKDNRNVRVFNQNTHSGKDIKKKNLTDLVNKSAKVGNSWPVLNAGSQLNGSNYYFEVEEGSSETYSGDVTVYSSFITRRR